MSHKDQTPITSSTQPVGASPAKAHVHQGAAGDDAARIWFVLLGVAGKSLKHVEVKQLHEAKKVAIRGPYTWAEIINHYNNGRIKGDFIVHEKGTFEWIPIQERLAPVQEQQVEEWYVLQGLSRKIVEAAFVQDLQEKGQVTVQGPYHAAQIVQLFEKGDIDKDTMVYRKGDRDWMPLAKQESFPLPEPTLEPSSDEASAEEPPDLEELNALGVIAPSFLGKHKIPILAILFVVLIAGGLTWRSNYKNEKDRLSQRDPATISKTLEKSIVYIVSLDSDNKELHRSYGFVVDDTGIIATDSYMLIDAANIKIFGAGKAELKVEGVINMELRSHIALLKVANTNHQLATIKKMETAKPKVGDVVYTLDDFDGARVLLSKGVVSALPEETSDTGNVEITAFVPSRKTGGPAVDETGHLIGMAYSGPRNYPPQGRIAVPVYQDSKVPLRNPVMLMKVLSDAAHDGKIIFKYPSEPKWKDIVLRHVVDAGYQAKIEDSAYRNRSLTFVQGAYDENSVTRYDDKGVRLWLKAGYKFPEMIVTPKDGNDMLNFKDVNVTEIILTDVDCANNKYRFNLTYGKNQTGSELLRSFYPDNVWYDMIGNDVQEFGDICRAAGS